VTTVGVGVIGHHRLDDPEEVSAAVPDVLGCVRLRFADTEATRLEALSPLPEGADRMVAQVDQG
jgi:hypothetical protein